MPQRRRQSAPRPRTMWLSLTPHAMTFTGNDVWDSQLMELETATLAVDWGRYVGGTVLRTIVDIVVLPVYPLNLISAEEDWVHFLHLGIGMTQDAAPEQTRWDPNTPHGDFMWRRTTMDRIYARENGLGVTTMFGASSSDGGVVRLDSTQRRRIREDERMWMFGHWFTPAVDYAGAIGYTGRVLIRLP